jgi:hypothetical protein
MATSHGYRPAPGDNDTSLADEEHASLTDAIEHAWQHRKQEQDRRKARAWNDGGFAGVPPEYRPDGAIVAWQSHATGWEWTHPVDAIMHAATGVRATLPA